MKAIMERKKKPIREFLGERKTLLPDRPRLFKTGGEIEILGNPLKELSNPGNLGNHGQYIDHKYEISREEKKKQWAAIGATPGLQEKAFLWADQYTRKMVGFITKDPELRKKLHLEFYPQALNFADDWVKAMIV